MKNSGYFVRMMKEAKVCVTEDEMFVSFEVITLFTIVLIGEAVEVIQERL